MGFPMGPRRWLWKLLGLEVSITRIPEEFCKPAAGAARVEIPLKKKKKKKSRRGVFWAVRKSL